MLNPLGKILIVSGLLLVAVGLVVLFTGRLTRTLGHLPLDLHIQRERYAIYFPLGTSLLISLILTILLNLIFNRHR